MEGGERIAGIDPSTLKDNQRAEVTIVIQQSKEGIIDRSADAVSRSVEGADDAVDGIFGDDDEHNRNSETPSADSDDGTANEDVSRDSDLIGGIEGIQMDADPTKRGTDDSTESNDVSTSPPDETLTATNRTPDVLNRNDRGLVP